MTGFLLYMPVRGRVVTVIVTGITNVADGDNDKRALLKGRFTIGDRGFSIFLSLDSIGHTIFQTPEEAWENIHVGDDAMYGADGSSVS